MVESITYSFCGGGELATSNLVEIQKLVQQLNEPKKSLVTNPAGVKGYLDFFVLDDGSIEMEIMEHDDDFATVDIPTALRVVEIAMTDIRVLPLRQRLEGLSINWLA